MATIYEFRLRTTELMLRYCPLHLVACFFVSVCSLHRIRFLYHKTCLVLLVLVLMVLHVHAMPLTTSNLMSYYHYLTTLNKSPSSQAALTPSLVR
jgi:hypothetical protein